MNCRKGTMSDLDAIEILVKEVIQDMENRGIHQWDDIYPTKDDFETDIQKDTLYVAEENGDLAGVYVINQDADDAYFELEWSSPAETACLLHRLCVSPKYQNKGVGSSIMAKVEELAKDMGYLSVRLDVFTENPGALHLYQKSCYEERGFADWRKGRFVLMEKVLS